MPSIARNTGTTKKRKPAAAAMGFPGKPMNNGPSCKDAASSGLPGRIATLWNNNRAFAVRKLAGMKSCRPIDTAPVLTMTSARAATSRNCAAKACASSPNAVFAITSAPIACNAASR
jgi:hypothetical protein